MNSLIKVLIIICGFSLLSCYITNIFATDDKYSYETAEKLKKTILDSWDSYSKYIDNLEMRFKDSSSAELADFYEPNQDAHCIVSFPNALYENTRTEKDGTKTEEIVCYNKDYAFSLIKTGESYEILAIEQITSPLNVNDLSDYIYNSPYTEPALSDSNVFMAQRISNFFCSGYYINHLLVKYLFSKNFSILSTERINDKNDEVVKIIFTCEPLKQEGGNILRGIINFLPQKYWQTKCGEVTFWDGEEEYTTKWENQFTEINHIPFCYTRISERIDINYMRKMKMEYSEISEIKPDSYFKLSYYGFPEPYFGEFHPNRIRYILVILGTLMILYAGWRIYRKHQMKSGNDVITESADL